LYIRIPMIKKNIPNLFTLCNLLCGCVAIVFALEGNLIWCAYMVGFACVFDLLDGLVARLLKVTSEIGKQLDSMADMVSFGVVPGVLLYKMIICTQLLVSFEVNPLSFISNQLAPVAHINYLAMTGFLVTIFSAIRLANFNIDTRQSYSFIGLPTPANAILIASLPLSIPESLTNMLRPTTMSLDQISAFGLVIAGKKNIYELLLQPYSVIALTLISSILLVAPIPLFALKFKNVSWADNKIRYIFLVLAPVLLILFKFLGIPLIIILYIVLSIINSVATKNEVQVNS
jgi:CDP-diacylglycerol---serine O-phosphatidyltransferase